MSDETMNDDETIGYLDGLPPQFVREPADIAQIRAAYEEARRADAERYEAHEREREDQGLRATALGYALQAKANDPSADVLTEARAFYAFLSGATEARAKPQ